MVTIKNLKDQRSISAQLRLELKYTLQQSRFGLQWKIVSFLEAFAFIQ